MNQYLIKPENGERADTKLAVEFSAEEITAMLANGYVLVDEDAFQLLIGNGDKDYCITDNGMLYERPAYAEPIETTKANKIAELKAERDALEVANIEYKGNTYDYDERSRERINIAITMLEAAPEETSISWALADNTTTRVTLEDLKAVIVAVGMRSEGLHERYRVAKTKVESASTADEIDGITL